MRRMCSPLQGREARSAAQTKWFSRAALSVLAATSLGFAGAAQAADERPNIVLLVADDVGFSDFPNFGGEAETPMMSSFAESGMTMTNFHVLPTCSPSRSAFLTGVDNHLNGMGTMQGQLGNPNNAVQVGNPGYTGYLNKRAITTATLLKDNGYNTYMTGKWHLGLEEDIEGGQTVFPQGWWPTDRGFERSYGVLEGGGEHFGSCERAEGHCTRFFEDDTIITADIPGDYFSSSSNMDKALEFIQADRELNGDERKPFFYYFADTMAHEPNQVPEGFIRQELIDLYYNMGWEGMRAQRLSNMKDLGIVAEDLELPAAIATMPSWDDTSDEKWDALMAKVQTAPYDVMWNVDTVDDLKHTLAKKMAAYTAMVEYFDTQVARLVDDLKANGEYENTVFMYFSDNGGDAREWDLIDQDYMLRRGVDNSYENIGNRNSFVSNGPEWAQVANTPLYGSKITMGEAGIRAPLVIAHPGSETIEAGSVSDTITTLTDIGTTVLSFAEVEHPVGTGVAPNWTACTGEYGDLTGICPANGKDLTPLLDGEVDQIHADEPLGFELFGINNKALFIEGADKNLWKILRLQFLGFGAGAPAQWKLFNLTDDPSESNNLAAENPEKLKEMIAMYNEYQSNVNVVSVLPGVTTTISDVAPGSDVSHTFTLTNSGDDSETYSVSCASVWPCKLAATEQSEVILGAGESADVEIVVSVPSTAVASESDMAMVHMMRENSPELSDSLTFITEVSETVAVASSSNDDNGGGLSANPLFLLLMFGLLFPRLRQRIRS